MPPAVDRRQTATMLLANQLVMFGQNIYLLIAVIFLLALFGVIVFAGWTALRAALFTWRQRREEEAVRAAKLDRDGRPLPPVAEGLCDRCQRAFNRVYHVPGGQRLCPTCYELALAARAVTAAGAPAPSLAIGSEGAPPTPGATSDRAARVPDAC